MNEAQLYSLLTTVSKKVDLIYDLFHKVDKESFGFDKDIKRNAARLHKLEGRTEYINASMRQVRENTEEINIIKLTVIDKKPKGKIASLMSNIVSKHPGKVITFLVALLAVDSPLRPIFSYIPKFFHGS